MSSDGEHEPQVELDLRLPAVATKYTTAAEILNDALKGVIAACTEGADVATLCRLGDQIITERTEKIYRKKERGEKIRKGVAFPTCVSVNELCGHVSPSKTDSTKLVKGDMAKIDMGVHIDGFIVVGAHTLVIGTDEITGRKADVLMAARTAAEAALRSIKVGATNTSVTANIQAACETFKCKAVSGVLSHQMKQHIIDGNKVIIGCETFEDRVEEVTFEMYEVYGVDIIVSSGEGKPKESEIRTTVFKRDLEQSYSLKTALARQFLAEVNTKHPTTPFSTSSFEDQRMSKLGVSECMRHGLLHAYPVMTEKPGDFVAQFKYTILLLPTQSKKVTGVPFDQAAQCKSEHSVTNEALKALLATPLGPQRKKKPAKQTDQAAA